MQKRKRLRQSGRRSTEVYNSPFGIGFGLVSGLFDFAPGAVNRVGDCVGSLVLQLVEPEQVACAACRGGGAFPVRDQTEKFLLSSESSLMFPMEKTEAVFAVGVCLLGRLRDVCPSRW